MLLITAIEESDTLTYQGHIYHPGSPRLTIFKTAGEIAYAESTCTLVIAIGPVDPELLGS